ncbi:hypothetical protein KVV02_001873, partial [Mortierella alpina]
MNWTGGRRTRIQQNDEQIRQRHHFERLRRPQSDKNRAFGKSPTTHDSNPKHTSSNDDEHDPLDKSGGRSCSTSDLPAASRIGSSTRGISAMDYEVARRACLRLLDSPKFDCLGEPYLLKPPSRPPALRNHQASPLGSKNPNCSSETESDTDVYQVDLTLDLSHNGDCDSKVDQGNE